MNPPIKVWKEQVETFIQEQSWKDWHVPKYNGPLCDKDGYLLDGD
jgi:hypothetical protein